MDKMTMDFNIGMNDRFNRFLVGIVLIALTMISSSTPTWVALAALYPVLTAIISWDPVYAVYNQIANVVNSKLSKKGGKLALS